MFFWANFCNLTNIFQKRKTNMKKDSWFFNAFKMPRARYGDFDKCHPIWSQFSFAMPQKSSNMFIPIITSVGWLSETREKKTTGCFQCNC
jgi:hypothetical protein